MLWTCNGENCKTEHSTQRDRHLLMLCALMFWNYSDTFQECVYLRKSYESAVSVQMERFGLGEVLWPSVYDSMKTFNCIRDLFNYGWHTTSISNECHCPQTADTLVCLSVFLFVSLLHICCVTSPSYYRHG